MSNRFIQDIDMSNEALGVEAIKRVGPKGHFLEDSQTLEYLHKEVRFRPTVFEWADYNTWEGGGKTNLIQRAEEKRQKLMTEHEVPPVELSIEKEIASILAAADKELG